MQPDDSSLLPLSAFPAADDPRLTLLAEYHRLVRTELPAAARQNRWPIRLDHCFARVLLDAIFNGCWYAYLDRRQGRSAESRLTADQLTRAVALARGMLALGHPEVTRLNAQSLAWRGKTPPPNRSPLK